MKTEQGCSGDGNKAVIEALEAISSKDNNKLEGLITGEKIDPNYRFPKGHDLIDFAFKKKNIGALRVLFENGARLQPPVGEFFSPCYRAKMWIRQLYSGDNRIDVGLAKEALDLYCDERYCGRSPFSNYISLFLGTIRDAVKDTGLHKKYNIELGSKDIDDLLTFIDEKDKAAKKTDSTKVKKHKHSCCSIF